MATQTLALQNGSTFTSRSSQPIQPAQRPQERKRQYKDFLTPLLHRRFTSAAGIVLGWCWFIAHTCSTDSWWWIWAPTPGMICRTLLLMLPCLAVFIVRVANIHVGERNANSPAEGYLLQLAGSKSASSVLHTLAWYLWSAWFFGEVYIWSKGSKENLAWIDPGQPYERPRLNEGPVFLRCLYLMLGVLQTINHLGSDYDRVDISSSQTKPFLVDDATAASTEPAVDLVSRLPRPLRMLARQFVKLGNRCCLLACTALMFCTLPLYFLVMRRSAWSITFTIARIFFSQLPPSAPPTGFALDHLFTLMIKHAFGGSIFLASLWQVSNATFDIFVAEAPLRKEQPLTSEIKDARGVVLHKSQDPNGSLLSGLKSKKEVPRAFAFWELYLICTQFDARRATIYTEFDREGGGASSTWRQICDTCLSEITKVITRAKSVDPRTGLALPKPAIPPYTPETAPSLPKIAAQGVHADTDVVLKPQQDLTQRVGHFARSIGQSAPANRPDAGPTLQRAADRLISPSERRKIVSDRVGEMNSYMYHFLQMPFGESFRQTFAFRFRAIVFGTPYSNRITIIHAAKALSRLTTCSLKEARFGGVAQDVPRIMRTFVDAIKVLEKLRGSLEPHWTDVLFTEDQRNVPEVEAVLTVVKQELESVLLGFGEYANDLGMSQFEVREAREICGGERKNYGKGIQKQAAPEMAQTNR